MRKVLTVCLLISISLFLYSQNTFSQNTDPQASSSADQAELLRKLQELQTKQAELQKKLAEVQAQKKTLSSQIAYMDNQVSLTNLKIEETQARIVQSAKDIAMFAAKIGRLDESLTGLSAVLLNRIVQTYKRGSVENWQLLISSQGFSDVFTRTKYIRLVQDHDKRLIYQVAETKNNYQDQKAVLEDKKREDEKLKQQLNGYVATLARQKAEKVTLLQVTQNDEKHYQELLSEAEAQIQGFKSFSFSKTGGGVSILPPQPSPDGWFYNQRDERWGRNTIGSSNEQIWDVGCLVTSVAMVLKKHGSSVTPSDIASAGGYFFSNTAYMLLPWASGKFSSTWGYSQSEVDRKLASGEVVIIGLRAGVYSQHFVVLKSGSGGNYIMNDPWNGPDLKFQDFYSTSQIFQYGFYNG